MLGWEGGSVIDKQDKKEAILAHNKKTQRIFQQLREQRQIIEDAREFDESVREQVLKSSPKGDEEVWSAKMGEIRNRLTGKKRAAKERWNRFAGTEGGGGRGL